MNERTSNALKRIEHSHQNLDEAILNDFAIVEQYIESIEQERDAIQEKFDHLSSEWNYDHDRGDHLVYRREWDAFDKWQRSGGIDKLAAVEAALRELDDAVTAWDNTLSSYCDGSERNRVRKSQEGARAALGSEAAPTMMSKEGNE